MSPAPRETHDFGDRVRQAREAAGLTIADAAARMGCRRQTWWRLENATTRPYWVTVLDLVERAGLPLEAFVPAGAIRAAADRLKGPG